MSRKVCDAPFAVTSEGKVVVNVTHYRGVKEVEELLALTVKEKGDVFIGVTLERHEVEHLLERLSHGASEAVRT